MVIKLNKLQLCLRTFILTTSNKTEEKKTKILKHHIPNKM